ncbi:MAG: hypothetical protein ACQES2_09965, partial [Pseudomonadota bacterium]
MTSDVARNLPYAYAKSQGVLAQISEDGEVRIAYRPDAGAFALAEVRR